MFVSVVSLSQPSSRVIINDFGICYMFVCVVSLSQPSSRVIINDFGICYMLNVCVSVVLSLMTLASVMFVRVLSLYLSPVVE